MLIATPSRRRARADMVAAYGCRRTGGTARRGGAGRRPFLTVADLRREHRQPGIEGHEVVAGDVRAQAQASRLGGQQPVAAG
ncbi:MAG: hypothetical protein R2719_09985 [Micropruina sp.]